MKIHFQFTNGSRFGLVIEDKKQLLARLIEFYEFVNKTNKEAETGKQFASGKTCLKFPTYRAIYIGIDKEDNTPIEPILDLNSKEYRYKGRSLENNLFPAYLEKQILHKLSGKLSPCLVEKFDPLGIMESIVVQERIETEAKKTQKLLSQSCNEGETKKQEPSETAK